MRSLDERVSRRCNLLSPARVSFHYDAKERRGPEEQKQEQEQEQERADVGGPQIVKAVEVD